jgi:L-fucose mutarotase
MLKGISQLISPKLLSTLSEMGHGDEIVFADAHFPGHTFNQNTLRADGLLIPDLLDAVLPLFELDAYVVSPVFMMQVLEGDTEDPLVESSYVNAISKHAPNTPMPAKIERFSFYEQAKKAYAVVMTGDTSKYGNIILKKGVTPTS